MTLYIGMSQNNGKTITRTKHLRESVRDILLKERYHQCTSIECGHTFVTHETFVRPVCRPQKINAESPHPKRMQEQFSLLIQDHRRIFLLLCH